MHFQPVPKFSALQASIPAGRSAVEPILYKLPFPAFGPGSVEYARRQAELLELAEEIKKEGDNEVSNPGPKTTGIDGVGTYAGAGSYF